MYKLRSLLVATMCGAITITVHAVPDAAGQISSAPAPDLSGDAVMKARLNYNLGYEKFEKAQRLEVSAGALQGAKARDAQEQVQRGYTEAREHFRTVVAADANMKEAWNLIGYTSRRLGEYDESLSAYETALKLNPEYPEAIEYRAELFLLTGRLDDVKRAHAQLAKSSPSYANVLLESARAWVQAQQKQLTVVSAADRDAFAAWVETQPKS
jgi:tetratricopeptide (TPR) repeat protein